MSKLNAADFLFLILLTVLMIGLGLGGTFDHDPTASRLNIVITDIFSWSLAIVSIVFFWKQMIGKRRLESEKVRPIVRVWSRNSITVVCAEAEYQTAKMEYTRAVKAGIEPDNLRIMPRYVGLFTDNKEKAARMLGIWHTGSMHDYDTLVAGCVIERSEMFIPQRLCDIQEGSYDLVSFTQLSRLVHNIEMCGFQNHPNHPIIG